MKRQSAVKKRPALFRALGPQEPPETVAVADRNYRHIRTFKHDSWAATALYEDPQGVRITCKFNRTYPVGPIPMRWAGRMLAAREAGFLRRLADVECVPDDLGPVTAGGRRLDNAVARVFVAGEPFRDGAQVDAGFYRALQELVIALHTHDMAYVDLHKAENIIVGPDRRPHLIDFQVSYALSRSWPGNGRIARFLLAQLQAMDRYHMRKHLYRNHPEGLTADQLADWAHPPAIIRAHRRIARPLRAMRRRFLTWLRIRDDTGSAASELEPEDAFRASGEHKHRH